MQKTAAARRPELKRVDPIWSRLQDEAEQVRANEPALAGFVYATVLSHASLEDALCHRLSQRLQHTVGDAGLLNRTFLEVIEAAPEVGEEVRADLAAWATRDPACERVIEPLLYFKGFHALETYRLSHILWHMGRRDLALYLQSQSSRVFAVDIHPAAKIGKGIMIDHATGIVIGETAVVGDNCSLLHGVTLGGTGNESGDRHPKIGSGVMLGAGAKVLGNISVGDCVRVAAGSVVLKDVPPRRTVAGVPAREIGFAGCEEPAIAMDQFVAGIMDDDESE
ncbi:Serine acetyltransferase [Methyloligella halotolerans]|uniref:Serine acetyltransferase n=1 Tax=Methyloligella halotolerans TaxID=1177755 RepID=A0A1E2S173_9HYPH|nr:serine O-acetyltransferase [Methyloligella halotolerans]ODA68204.1 Serine acetyltransferase [Methyloligella halotolerans]